MAVESARSDDILVHIHDLTDPNVQLDVTTDPWLLKDGQVSDYAGWDLTRQNRARPAVGRLSGNVEIASSDQPIVSAFPGLDFADITVREVFHIQENTGSGGTWGTHLKRTAAADACVVNTITVTHDIQREVGLDQIGILNGTGTIAQGVYPVNSLNPGANTISTGSPFPGTGDLTNWVYFLGVRSYILFNPSSGGHYLVKSPVEYTETGAFADEYDNATVFVNDDDRLTAEESTSVISRATVFQTNDALEFSSEVGVTEGKITISRKVTGDLRGLWVTNGRKFWLLQNGTYNLKLDLGTGVDLGTEWRMSRIATNRVMFVSPKYAPRVLHLDAETTTTTAGESSLAGCIPPKKTVAKEAFGLGALSQNSWAAVRTTGGSLTAGGAYKIQVRAVNLDDNLESEFVPVYLAPEHQGTASGYETYLTRSVDDDCIPDTGGAFNIVSTNNSYQMGPATSERWTHIEVWRTIANGTVYYLEARLALTKQGKNSGRGSTVSGYAFNERDQNEFFLANDNPDVPTISVSDVNAPRLPVQISADTQAGRLPPMCQDVVSVKGVTFFLGKADATTVNPTVKARGFANDAGVNVDDTWGSTVLAPLYRAYRFETGDELVITRESVSDTENGTPGTYPISASPATYIVSVVRHQSQSSATGLDSGSTTDVTDGMTDPSLMWTNAGGLSGNFPAGAIFKVTLNQTKAQLTAGERLAFCLQSEETGTLSLYAYSGATSVSTGYVQTMTLTFPANPNNPDSTGTDRHWWYVEFSLDQALIDELDTGTASFRLAWDQTSSIGMTHALMTSDTGLTMESSFSDDYGTIDDDDFLDGLSYIQRDVEIDWPTISSDEDVFHTRTDLNAPESVVATPVVLSTNGDIYRRAVGIGRYVAVIMDQGVHLLFTSEDNSEIELETVVETAEGTPWKESVFTYADQVMWATPKGVNVLSVSPNSNVDGKRGQIQPLGGDRFSAWFGEAFDNEETVDGGVDWVNALIHFRRQKTAPGGGINYQVLQYSIRTDRWTLLDDQTGLAFRDGINAVATPPSGRRLYSVTEEGAVFEMNRRPTDGTWQHAAATLTGTVGGTSTTTSVTKSGLGWTSDLVGEPIRFRDTSGSEHVARVTDVTGDVLTFTPTYAGIDSTDTFYIAAMRTRIKATLAGRLRGTVKKVRGCLVRAVPGYRANDDSTDTINVALSREFEASEASGTTEIFLASASGKEEEDRVPVLEELEGNGLEVLLESYVPKFEYALQQFEVRVEEESDDNIDMDDS